MTIRSLRTVRQIAAENPAEPAPMTATSNPSCPGRLQQSFIAYRFLEALAAPRSVLNSARRITRVG